MPRKKIPPKPAPPLSTSAFEQAWSRRRPPQGTSSEQPPTVSGRWLLTAAGATLAAAATCAWLTLCILYWQGSWQLLYHPASAVARTPASVGLAFDPMAFAATEDGEPLLKGWWIPAAPDAPHRQYTVLYLHGQTGNLGDCVDGLAALHAVGVNILAFDYRGYGQSLFAHPSEARWRQDAEWALEYLTATRHVPAGAIVVEGSALGANLALEIAAARPELAGVVLESPLASPVDAIFRDPRSRLVPAHLLVRDRFDADQAATALRIPSLWLLAPSGAKGALDPSEHPSGYDRITARKTLVWLTPSDVLDEHFTNEYSRWLDDLPKRTPTN
ncbi:MAG TPA: alpha/beta fold hydrolase [Terracidiphilus sp.]|nr:alpha/beta fold hydrolase [Terracidiphilus sp.]